MSDDQMVPINDVMCIIESRIFEREIQGRAETKEELALDYRARAHELRGLRASLQNAFKLTPRKRIGG